MRTAIMKLMNHCWHALWLSDGSIPKDSNDKNGYEMICCITGKIKRFSVDELELVYKGQGPNTPLDRNRNVAMRMH